MESYTRQTTNLSNKEESDTGELKTIITEQKQIIAYLLAHQSPKPIEPPRSTGFRVKAGASVLLSCIFLGLMLSSILESPLPLVFFICLATSIMIWIL